MPHLALHHTLHVLHVVVEHGHGDDAHEGGDLRIKLFKLFKSNFSSEFMRFGY